MEIIRLSSCQILASTEPTWEGPMGTPSLAHARHTLLTSPAPPGIPPRTRIQQSNSNFLSFVPRNSETPVTFPPHPTVNHSRAISS